MPSTAQPAPETDEKKSRGLGSYVLWAFVAVMVYVLSSGPAYKFQPQYHGKVYAPLWWLYWRSPLHRPIGMYWHLWRPQVFTSDGSCVQD